jgi:tetratricopeptide (TPR) repeat protein
MVEHWTSQVRAVVGVVGFVAAIAAVPGCGRGEVPDLLWQSGASPGRDAFFGALAHGDYDALDPVIADLTGEAADGDEVSQAVLGFAHAWRVAERARYEPDPEVIGHIDLAVTSFERAVDAIPHDPRLVGFLGSMQLAQGNVWGDNALIRKGWFGTKASARQWPEWGLFTQAYGLVTLDPDEPRYAKGIELLWDNLDACVDERVDREDLDWSVYEAQVDRDEDAWNRRACANTDVVPHGVEGFFLIFGDVYAKAGELDAADMMYKNALGSVDVADWPYRWVAEDRRARLDELPEQFRGEAPEGPFEPTEWLVFGGPVGCTVCHQREAAPPASSGSTPSDG